MLLALATLVLQSPPLVVSRTARVDFEEIAVIGAEVRDAQALFGSIGSVAALRDRIYVYDGYDSSIKVFGADGQRLATWGRSGEGPGEFSGPVVLAVGSGGLFAVDQRTGRMTAFDDDGVVVEERRIEGLPGPPAELGFLSGGEVIISTFPQFSTNPQQASITSQLVLVTPSGGTRTIRDWNAGIAYWQGSDRPVPMPAAMAFGPESGWALSEEGILAVVNGYDGVIEWFDTAAQSWRPIATARLEWKRRTITDDVRESVRADLAQRTRSSVPGGEVVYPPAFSNLGAMFFDDLSRLWIVEALDSRLHGEPKSARRAYVVDAADPESAIMLELPAGLHPSTVWKSHLIGTGRTDFDVPTLMIYRINGLGER